MTDTLKVLADLSCLLMQATLLILGLGYGVKGEIFKMFVVIALSMILGRVR